MNFNFESAAVTKVPKGDFAFFLIKLRVPILTFKASIKKILL